MEPSRFEPRSCDSGHLQPVAGRSSRRLHYFSRNQDDSGGLLSNPVESDSRWKCSGINPLGTKVGRHQPFRVDRPDRLRLPPPPPHSTLPREMAVSRSLARRTRCWRRRSRPAARRGLWRGQSTPQWGQSISTVWRGPSRMMRWRFRTSRPSRTWGSDSLASTTDISGGSKRIVISTRNVGLETT